MELPNLQPNQFGVIHAETKTGIILNLNGRRHIDGEEAMLVFDSFEEAETYCNQKVSDFPDVECNIIDHLNKRISRIVCLKNARLWHNDKRLKNDPF